VKLELKDFQETAVARLHRRARAAAEAAGDELSAIVLSAPTGSGKTVVATSLMERISAGDEETLGDPEAVFLWLTDQPELNEQTRKKFEAYSDVFTTARLFTLDVAYDKPRLEPGCAYFLNTQKLARGSLLVRTSDMRQYTLWEIVANTLREASQSFWLVIDEAHRGMGVTQQQRDEAQTIVQKFILGSREDGLPPVPLILGITATPQRFNELLAGTERTNRPVEIKPEDVRESGLLKDLVTVSHPTESQPADVTLLRAAAAELESFRKEWDAYAGAEATRRVEPLLVVQIEDARQGSKEISRTAVDEAIAAIESELGPLGDDEIGHSLQEGHAVTVGERTIRYVAPSDIEEQTKLRVVLFKSSLNTGWDCPRAEVMMSFRRAVDLTHIAQLVGRMVRTPLARRVTVNEFLNSVSLYLPHYDASALSEVVSYLSDPVPEIGIGTDVKLREETLELELDPNLVEAADLVETLPTYSIERIAKTTNVRRLMRLGRELAYDGLDKDALKRYRAKLLKVLDRQRQKRLRTETFKNALKAAATLDIERVAVTYGREGELVVEERQLEVAGENIEDLYSQAGRLLGEGLHAAYVKARVESDSDAKRPATRGKSRKGASSKRERIERPRLAAAKAELYALLQIEDVRTTLEATAGADLRAAFKKHDPAIRKLSDERRQRYRRLSKLAREPEPYSIELPERIFGQVKGKAWKKHLYVGKGKVYHAELNTWEEHVLKAALAEKGAIAWLRNVPRKEWSLCVSYKGADGHDRGLYPDFLVFRKQNGSVVCDILDPHMPGLADAWAKAVGLAEYATRHGDDFGRIKQIAKVGKKMKELDLKDEDTRSAVRAVDSNAALLRLLEEA